VLVTQCCSSAACCSRGMSGATRGVAAQLPMTPMSIWRVCDAPVWCFWLGHSCAPGSCQPLSRQLFELRGLMDLNYAGAAQSAWRGAQACP
jgi:hypothetical protein